MSFPTTPPIPRTTRINRWTDAPDGDHARQVGKGQTSSWTNTNNHFGDHKSSDTPETLDYDRFARVVGGLHDVVWDWANGE